MSKIHNSVIAQIVKDAGGNKAEAARRVVNFYREGFRGGKFKAENVSLMCTAAALGLIDPFDVEGSVRRCLIARVDRTPETFNSEALYQESSTLMTNAFQTVCTELIESELIAGYNGLPSLADKLVTTRTSQRRNAKVAGFTHLGQSFEVSENHPYPAIRFGEKWVSMKEVKYGAMIEVTEELLTFDQTGDIGALARSVGEGLRNEREVLILNGIQDTTNDIYRPSGVAEALYSAGNMNLKTSNALVDWTDIDAVLTYRATTVKDDRIDGTQRPIAGLNKGDNILLVPEALRSTAWYIKNATGQVINTATAANETNFGNPVSGYVGSVESSPYLDVNSTSTYYYGDFKRQFVWSEIWPLQSFVQGADSNAAFERDCTLRVKARYYGGLSALDSVWVTQVTA